MATTASPLIAGSDIKPAVVDTANETAVSGDADSAEQIETTDVSGVRVATLDVPFYSQFADISDPSWKKIGCGIASLAMVLDYYKPAVAVDTLLQQGIDAGAYLQSAGWTYKGLIGVGRKYGLDGESYDLAPLDSNTALARFEEFLDDGPIIASVHYNFDPKSTIPHLVVINRIQGGLVHYNDPAAKMGGLTISTTDFLKAWKKRFIVIRPVQEADLAIR